MRLIDADRLENNLSCSCMGFGTGVFNIIRNCETIRPETLPIVKELRAEIERLNRGIENLSKNVENAYKQRDAAMKDLRECAIESYTECMYCSHDNKGTLCWNCTNGSNWEWRGVKDENNSSLNFNKSVANKNNPW